MDSLDSVTCWSRIKLSVSTIHPDVDTTNLGEMFTVRVLQEAWAQREQAGSCPILELCTFEELLEGRDKDGKELFSRFAVSVDHSGGGEGAESCWFEAVVPSSWLAGIDTSQSLSSRSFE